MANQEYTNARDAPSRLGFEGSCTSNYGNAINDHERMQPNVYSEMQVALGSHETYMQCCYCEQYFTSKASLVSHLDTHLNQNTDKCLQCGQAVSQFEPLVQLINCLQCRYKCLQCSKMCRESGHLKRPAPTPLKKSAFTCLQCDKEFNDKGHLEHHLCDKANGEKRNLERQMQTNFEKHQFKCLQCEKVFGAKSQLEGHLQTHFKHHIFKCLQCDKKFGEKCHLERHLCDKAFGGNAI